MLLKINVYSEAHKQWNRDVLISCSEFHVFSHSYCTCTCNCPIKQWLYAPEQIESCVKQDMHLQPCACHAGMPNMAKYLITATLKLVQTNSDNLSVSLNSYITDQYAYSTCIYIHVHELSQLSCLTSSVGRASRLECARHGFESHPFLCLRSCFVLCGFVFLSPLPSVWVFMHVMCTWRWLSHQTEYRERERKGSKERDRA